MAGTQLHKESPGAAAQNTRSKYVAGAALAACVAVGGVFMLGQGEPSSEAAPEPTEQEVPLQTDGAPSELAMTDQSCEEVEDAVAAIGAVAHVGPEAIAAMQRLGELVPAHVQNDVDTIVATYEALEAGHVEQLLDDDQVGATAAAGDAVASYLAESCNVEMEQK